MVTMVSREFWPDFMWDEFADGSVAVSDTASYLVHTVTADGTPTRVLAREPAPRAATEDDREAARQRVRDQAEEGLSVRIGGSGPDEETSRRLLEQRLENMTFAELIPRITDLSIDPLGRIWVGVSEDIAGETARIDVYDRDGRLVGEVRGVPFPDVFLGADRIGVLRRDDLDVQQVVILELEAGVTG